MKITIHDGIYLLLDLSEYPEEVVSYVIDQLPDRLNIDTTTGHEFEMDSNLEEKWIKISSPILDEVWKTIEEKENDIEYERRHGERE